MRTADEVTARYIVQPPPGRCGSGFVSFWVIRDTRADAKDGNNIVDYFSDCLSDAEERVRLRASRYNSGEIKAVGWGHSYGDPA